MTTAVVVGAGPNGLAAALTLAQAGVEVHVREAHAQIGGGTRSADLTRNGLIHDVCAAAHPFGIASPYLSSLPLAAHGLGWAHPTIAASHPLDDGSGASLIGGTGTTAAALQDPNWARLFGPIERSFDDLVADVLGPVLRTPTSPVRFGQFGMRAALPASAIAKLLRNESSRALFAGMAAHVIRPFNQPLSSSVAALLIAAGHAVGWPVAVGGSHQISKAMASLLESLGGQVTTSDPVTDAAELDADIIMFDLAPGAVARLLNDRLPPKVRNSFTRWKHGPAAYKVDLAIEGDIPWTHADGHQAGTLHLGGSFAEIAHAEREVCAGRMPARPFVLVGQQYLADPTRSANGINPVWSYAHVPNGYTGNATTAVLDQFERFAPGTRDRVVAMHVTPPADFERYNANYVGGDILTGANTVGQLIWRPSRRMNPYGLGLEGHYICSAATPPGAGVHGMCGWHAAQTALADLNSTLR